MGTVYVSDLDGTLLPPGGRMPDADRDAIEGLVARGVPFTVASARSVVSMQGVLSGLRLELPVVCFNGGFVSELATGRHLEVATLETEQARGAWQMAKDLGLIPIVSTTDGVSQDQVWIAHDRNEGVELYVKDRRAAQDPRLRFVSEPGGELGGRVTCLTVIERREEAEAWERAVVEAYGDALQPHLFDDIYMTGWTWVTVHAGAATKGSAVRRVMERAGLTGHRLVAFGDQENDLPLFAEADHAVAVANAVDSVKAAADEVIGHHADGAVLRWLLENA